jgi:hypothetical protein
MNDTLYHYIDPGFSHTQVGNYTLLLLLNPVNFSLAVMHKEKLMVWRKTAPLSELNMPGEVQEVLGFSYQEVVPGITSANFALVPQSLFETDNVADVARYLNVQPTDTVFAQPLDADNHIVFKANATLTKAAARFDSGKIVFGAGGWIKAIALHTPSNYNLYLNVNDGQLQIAHFRHSKLHLYNTFEISHEDELAYYTAFVCQQLKLDMALTTIVLSGDITNGNTGYHQILGDIFKTVELNDITVAEIPQGLPKHQLLPLTALQLCASLADA